MFDIKQTQNDLLYQHRGSKGLMAMTGRSGVGTGTVMQKSREKKEMKRSDSPKFRY